ncbi:MAG TPA: hypothetical protein VJ695_02180 [Nitrososphaera sp.]|nr:hypothetical protein [Nitrososphaera sp.]
MTIVSITLFFGAWIFPINGFSTIAYATTVEDEEEDDGPGDTGGDIQEEENDTQLGESAGEIEYTTFFRAEDCNYTSTGRNPYFILEPNFQLVLLGQEGGEAAQLTITVLNETRQVNGTETRVVEERETIGSELVEVSRNSSLYVKRQTASFTLAKRLMSTRMAI